MNDENLLVETFALVAAGAVLGWQFYQATRYWSMSVGGERAGPRPGAGQADVPAATDRTRN
jgi:hypothetical protein